MSAIESVAVVLLRPSFHLAPTTLGIHFLLVTWALPIRYLTWRPATSGEDHWTARITGHSDFVSIPSILLDVEAFVSDFILRFSAGLIQRQLLALRQRVKSQPNFTYRIQSTLMDHLPLPRKAEEKLKEVLSPPQEQIRPTRSKKEKALKTLATLRQGYTSEEWERIEGQVARYGELVADTEARKTALSQFDLRSKFSKDTPLKRAALKEQLTGELEAANKELLELHTSGIGTVAMTKKEVEAMSSKEDELHDEWTRQREKQLAPQLVKEGLISKNGDITAKGTVFLLRNLDYLKGRQKHSE